MSDVSVTLHNLAALMGGKIKFSQFRDGEAQLLKENIAALPAVIQPAAAVMLASLEAGASSLVGAGDSAIGPLISQSSDAQATLFLNLLEKLGVPTGGAILSVAEHAALVMALNGVKAGLDQLGLKITTAGVQVAPVAAAA